MRKITRWLRDWVKRKFYLYDIEELQAGGWCGLCGKWLPDVVVEKWWPYTICPGWATDPNYDCFDRKVSSA